MDALVADSTADDFAVHFPFDVISRSSTPSVPPGFEHPHGHPPPQICDDFIAKPQSRIVPTSAPFTPSRAPSFIPRASTPLANVSIPTTPTKATPISTLEIPASQAKQDLKTLATNTGLSKTIASQAASAHANLRSEDFPALESGKMKVAKSPALSRSISATKLATVPISKIPTMTPSNITTTPQPLRATQRATPGILNISLSSQPAINPTGKPESSIQAPMATSSFPPLPYSNSSVASLQSPQLKHTPKTLRVLPTPKMETPTAAGSATPPPTTSIIPPVLSPFRQPSLASISKVERPGTPTSEIISDNASITSASMSRPSSPPPSKVGSAPVRNTTKSMQKKQRKEAQKEKVKTEMDIAAPKPEPEVEIAPIMGRKKKQKKEKSFNVTTGTSTPAASRAPSPGPEEPEERKLFAESTEQTTLLPETVPEKPVANEQDSNLPTSKAPDMKSKGKSKAVRSVSPEPIHNVAKDDHEVVEKSIPTPASILQELMSSGYIQDATNLNILKHPSVSFRHQDQPLDIQNVNHKLTITPEDRTTLLSGLPVHKNVEGPNRIMLTPNGDCVRNLTPEEEERYLELQARIAEGAGPTAFLSNKYHESNGFTLIGGRAVPNGLPAFFPLARGSTTPIDPVSKIQRDEALSYINQYVLPSLSSNSQLEKALNANALDAEVLRSGDPATWTSWANDPAAPRTENSEGVSGSHHHEGILASGLESMTAHFAVGRDNDRGQPLGNVSLLSQSEAESALQMARKETESLEKKLNALLKKNRRLLLGTGH